MKKHSLFNKILIGTAIFICAVIVIGCGVFIYYWKTHSNKTSGETSEASKTTVVDMNDPNSGDYGKLYYAPIDEKHIAEEDSTRFIDNEVLIVVKDGVNESQVRELAAKYNSEIVGEIEISGDYQLRLDKVSTKEELEGILQQIETEDIIHNASLSYVIEISETGDGYAGFTYGDKWEEDLRNYNDVLGKSWGIEVINTMGAWKELDDHKGQVKPVKVGLIDTGFEFDHDDLGFAEVFYDNGKNDETSTDLGHGTHVAGIMAAKANNDIGICGVYPYGDGMLYGVSNCGQGVINKKVNTTEMAEKISYAELIVRNVKVINSSRGSEGYWEYKKDYDECADLLGDFLNRMLSKGYDFVIVSAAGNGSRGLTEKKESRFSSFENLISSEKYPNVYNRIIVVGAVDYKLGIAAYSDAGERVDIFAPGGDETEGQKCIYSTLPGNTYGLMFETSIAAPHVAGVAAMVWSANNSLNGAQVKEIIRSKWNPRCTSCHLVDAEQAVREAFTTEGKGSAQKPENGVVMGLVVERFHEDTRIENAKIAMKNVETGETIRLKNDKGEEILPETDSQGHFEIAAPEGKYTISVTADGFENYEWPDEDNYTTPIIVKNGEVNYLDWVKLRRSETKLIVHAYDKDTAEAITDKEITITVTNPELSCSDPKQTLGKEDGSATFYIATGKMKGFIEADVTLHIDGYKDFVFEEYPFDDKMATLQELSALFEKEEIVSTPLAYVNDEGYVVFGHYEQDGNAENGKEPIEWVIVDENENGKLLMSRYVLDCVPYNNEYEYVTWETCSLRAWLNDGFINDAFSEEELAQILKEHIESYDIESESSNYTDDQVFCLSLDELTKYYKFEYDPYSYFGYCKELIVPPTTYAMGNGMWTYTVDAADDYFFEYAPEGYVASCVGMTGASWWLRTTGWEKTACLVLPYGYAGANYDFGVSSEGYGVRPTLWLGKDAIEDSQNSASNQKEITFGRYAGEDIKWIVLDESNDGMFVLSKNVIDAHTFNDRAQNVTWENSSLRAWLNGDFYKGAFSAEEKERIRTTTVKTPPNPKNGTDGGKDAEDHIFLLSIDEVNKYFSSDKDRTAEATEYAAKNVYLIPDAYGNSSCWWLRSMDYPGTDSISCAAMVTYEGTIASEYVYEWTTGVRPAMWISKDGAEN